MKLDTTEEVETFAMKPVFMRMINDYKQNIYSKDTWQRIKTTDYTKNRNQDYTMGEINQIIYN